MWMSLKRFILLVDSVPLTKHWWTLLSAEERMSDRALTILQALPNRLCVWITDGAYVHWR